VAALQAEAITSALVNDLNLSEVEVDAFWSFVKKASFFWRGGKQGDGGGPEVGMHKP